MSIKLPMLVIAPFPNPQAQGYVEIQGAAMSLYMCLLSSTSIRKLKEHVPFLLQHALELR